MRKSCLPLLLSLALMAGIAPHARAEEDGMTGAGEPTDPGYRFYENEAKKILRTAGNKVWEAAKHAYRTNLFQFAHEQAQRAIRFDPDQPDARDYLKYIKRKKGWEQDKEAYQKLSKSNTRGGKNGKQMSVEAFEAIMKKWKEERLAPANAFVAKRYAKLGDVCASKGFALQAKKGYEWALRLDKNNAGARKGLGFKKFGRVWLTPKQDQARKDAGKATQYKEESRADISFGVTHNKVESRHFRIESLLPVDELKELAHAAETAYAYYLADFGKDPTADLFERRKALFVYMQDGEHWKTWVDSWGSEDKEFTLKMSGTGGPMIWGYRIKAGSNPTSRKDSILHRATHIINRRLWGPGKRAWLDEGLAYYYSTKVQETCLTYCAAIKKGEYGNSGREGGIKEWQEPTNWKPLIKGYVAAKNDMPLRTLLHQPITKLEFAATVKAWAVITWLMDTDRNRFLEFWDLMRSGGKQEDVLQQLYGKGVEEIDEEWRTYARRNY